MNELRERVKGMSEGKGVEKGGGVQWLADVDWKPENRRDQGSGDSEWESHLFWRSQAVPLLKYEEKRKQKRRFGG